MTNTLTNRAPANQGWIGDAVPFTAELFRLRALEGSLDPQTTRLLRDEIGVRHGMRCLDVGAGAGSIVRWLSERVGPTGEVLALDMNCRFLTDLPRNVTVVAHRLGDRFPELGTFDLIHHRAVLNYVESPAGELATLIATLRPGGRILSEEIVFPNSGDDAVVEGGALLPAARKVCQGVLDLLARAGTHMKFGLELPSRLREAGLVDVDHQGATYLTPGSDGCRADVWWPIAEKLAEQLKEVGLSGADVAAGVAGLKDATTWHRIPTIMSAWGRRPGYSAWPSTRGSEEQSS